MNIKESSNWTSHKLDTFLSNITKANQEATLNKSKTVVESGCWPGDQLLNTRTESGQLGGKIF